MAYENEVICLIQFPVEELQAFLSSALPTGTVVVQHHNGSAPQWLERARDLSSATNWAQATEQAQLLRARLRFCPKVVSCLGLVGATYYSDIALLPRAFGYILRAQICV